MSSRVTTLCFHMITRGCPISMAQPLLLKHEINQRIEILSGFECNVTYRSDGTTNCVQDKWAKGPTRTYESALLTLGLTTVCQHLNPPTPQNVAEPNVPNVFTGNNPAFSVIHLFNPFWEQSLKQQPPTVHALRVLCPNSSHIFFFNAFVYK